MRIYSIGISNGGKTTNEAIYKLDVERKDKI